MSTQLILTRWIGAVLLTVVVSGCGGGSANLPTSGTTPQANTAEMVFIGRTNGDNTLFTANLNGSNLKAITTASGTRPFSSLSWARSGRRIFYTNFLGGGRGGTLTNVRSIGSDGTGDREINDGNTGGVELSPDETQILYSGFFSTSDGANTSSQSGVFIANADGSNARLLTEGSQASWSPDGQRIAFVQFFTVEVPEAGVGISVSALDILTMNVDGSDKKRLTSALGGEREPHFSPDGSRIVYAANDTTYNRNTGFENRPAIYTMSADGSDRKLVARAFELSDIENPRWTRDGRRIAFLRVAENGGLYVINADSSNEVRLQGNFDATGIQSFDLR